MRIVTGDLFQYDLMRRQGSLTDILDRFGSHDPYGAHGCLRLDIGIADLVHDARYHVHDFRYSTGGYGSLVGKMVELHFSGLDSFGDLGNLDAGGSQLLLHLGHLGSNLTCHARYLDCYEDKSTCNAQRCAADQYDEYPQRVHVIPPQRQLAPCSV